MLKIVPIKVYEDGDLYEECVWNSVLEHVNNILGSVNRKVISVVEENKPAVVEEKIPFNYELATPIKKINYLSYQYPEASLSELTALYTALEIK